MYRFIGFEDVPRVAIGVRVHSHARQPQLAAGTNQADGNLSAVSDEDFHARLFWAGIRRTAPRASSPF
jgi:hypothetical protein